MRERGREGEEERTGRSYSFQLHLLPSTCLIMFPRTPSVEKLAFRPFGRFGGKTAPGAISESIALMLS
jgi:hypothetical protein